MKIHYISILRVLAMLSIVIGHLLSFWHINTYQFGGIGVELFLLLSGFLYGERAISNNTSWLKKRSRRIMISLWIWCAIVLLSVLICKFKFATNIIPCIFGIQGLDFIFPFTLSVYPGLRHTWYLTVLLLFFPLVLILNHNTVLSFLERRWKETLVVAVLMQVVVAVVFHTQIAYFVQLLVGFFLGKKLIKLERKSITILTIITFILCVIRVFARRVLDGTALYDKVIAIWTANLLMLIVFYLVREFCARHPEGAKKLTEGRVWLLLDMLSYEIYLTHYLFLKEDFSISLVAKSAILQIPVFVVVVFLSAALVHALSEKTISFLQRREET